MPRPARRKIIISLALLGLVMVMALTLLLAPQPAAGMLLGSLGGAHSAANAINERGQVVGWATVPSGEMYAFIWTQETGMQKIDTPGYSSEATAIDEKGQVAGYYYPTKERDKTRSFIWTPGHGAIDLGTLGDSNRAFNFTKDGAVCGYLRLSNGKQSFFVWTKEDGMREDESAFLSYNFRNSLGQQIEHKNRCAFVVQKNESWHKLSLFGGLWSEARVINNKGQVVGLVIYKPSWWQTTWIWFGRKLNLPDKYRLHQPDYDRTEAALWTVPPEEE